MNKNGVIGVLIVILVIVVGFIFYKNSDMSSTTSGGSPAVALRADAPTVATGSDVSPSNSTAVVTGQVTPNGAPTTYWYEYGESASFGNRTTSQAIGSGFSSVSTPGYITGLRASTLYYFRLNAENSFGTVHGDTRSFQTNNNVPTKPAWPAVQTDSATDITRTNAMIHGHVNPNLFATTYWFEYGETRDLGNITSFQNAGNGNASIAVTGALSGLKPLTKYYYRLNGQNQYGTINGDLQNFTTLGPADPGAPHVDTTSASKITASSATFNGTLDPNGADTTYYFEYSADSLLRNIIGSVSPSQSLDGTAKLTAVKLDVGSLSSDTDYFYRLVGKNQYGIVTGDIVSFHTSRQ